MDGAPGASAPVPPREKYVYYPDVAEVPEKQSVNVHNRSYSLGALVDFPAPGAEGVLFAHGARFGGHALYVKDNRLHYVYSFVGLVEQKIDATEDIATGKDVILAASFEKDGEDPPGVAIGAETINVIDAFADANIGELDQSSKSLGGSSDFAYNMVGVAEDGAIYVGNLTTSGTLIEFILYRWENEAGPQVRVYGPSNPGNTTAGNSRWGDTLTVRGSGINTEVLIASRGTLAAILRPTDSSMTAFAATTLATDVPAGGLGYGLAFGAGNTF